MNICIFQGRLARDIEIRYSSNNLAIGRTAIAVDFGFGDKKKTSFLDLTSFGKTAENMERFFSKGSRVLVKCHADQNKYTNKEGKQVSSIGFIVDEFEFVESKSSSTSSASAPNTGSQASPDDFLTVPDDVGDELPFR